MFEKCTILNQGDDTQQTCISRVKEKLKASHDKNKLEESITIMTAQQRTLKGTFHSKMDNHNQEATGNI